MEEVYYIIELDNINIILCYMLRMKIKQILYMNVFKKINFPIQPLLLLAAYENKTNIIYKYIAEQNARMEYINCF